MASRQINSVHVDIARLVFEFSEISVDSMDSKEKLDAKIAGWTRSLVRSLALRDPSLNSYGAFLMAEMEAYKKADSERKKEFKCKTDSKDSKDSLQRKVKESKVNKEEEEEKEQDFSLSQNHSENPNPPDKPKRKTKPNPEESKFELPEHLADNPEFVEAWEGFMEIRKKKRAAQTKFALQMIIDKLRTFSKGSQKTAIAILNKSTTSSWSDVFELKDGIQNGRATAKDPSTPYDPANP